MSDGEGFRKDKRNAFFLYILNYQKKKLPFILDFIHKKKSVHG